MEQSFLFKATTPWQKPGLDHMDLQATTPRGLHQQMGRKLAPNLGGGPPLHGHEGGRRMGVRQPFSQKLESGCCGSLFPTQY